MWASEGGHTSTAEMLVSRGADVNAKDKNVSLGMGGCKGFLFFLGLFISSCCICFVYLLGLLAIGLFASVFF